MRKIKFLTVALLALTIISCSKDDDNTVVGQTEDGNGNSYISIAIKAPSSSETRANSAGKAASDIETVVTRVIYYGFDAVGICLNSGIVEDMVIPETGGSPTQSKSIIVSDQITQLFVVVNPTDALFLGAESNGAEGTTFSTLNEAVSGITATTLSQYVDGTDIMMTNSEGLVAVAPTPSNVAVVPTSVTVDRVVSKVKLATFTAVNIGGVGAENVPTNARVAVTGFSLNTTNKSMFLYAEYITYGSKHESYRIDPNFDTKLTGAEAKDAFTWLTNSPTEVPTFNPDDKYCIENTVSVAATDNNNITSMMIKATYFPENVTGTESWFTFQNVEYNFDGLIAKYETLNAANTTKFDAFMTKLGITAKISTYESIIVFETALAAATPIISQVPGVTPYDFAQVEPNGILLRYFKDGVCYYSVPLNHDNSILDENALGKWGVVRNNFYTLTINKIMSPGAPFIPDPTDPDIKDPGNPDPDNPDTPDAVEANIAVSITMNPWSSWDQDVDL